VAVGGEYVARILRDVRRLAEIWQHAQETDRIHMCCFGLTRDVDEPLMVPLMLVTGLICCHRRRYDSRADGPPRYVISALRRRCKPRCVRARTVTTLYALLMSAAFATGRWVTGSRLFADALSSRYRRTQDQKRVKGCFL
jgi:hypothetical protein